MYGSTAQYATIMYQDSTSAGYPNHIDYAKMYFVPFLSRWWFIAIHLHRFQLPTIYLSTVSPGPLTAVAQTPSPGLQSPAGLGNPGSPIDL